MRSRRYLAPLLLSLSAACLLNVEEPDFSINTDFQFSQTGEGWTAHAVDYPAAREADLALQADRRARPAELGSTGLALYTRANNISADLFTYWVRHIDGLFPGQTYTVSFDVEYASNIGRDCTVGVGPAVWIKAGLVAIPPQRVLDGEGWYRLNVDKGQQAQGSSSVLTLGDIRNNRSGCATDAPYGIWGRQSAADALTVTTTPEGALWIILGTESGFEGSHDIYFTRLRMKFRPKN